jgi:hypothetical protein
MALMDLCTEAAADQGIEIDIYHPATGKPLGIAVRMLGTDSQVYADTERKIKNRMLELGKRKRDFSVGLDSDSQEAALIEKMTACFLSWKETKADGTVKDTVEFEDGVELAGSKAEFKKIISRRGFFWFRAQVQEGMDKIASFLPPQKSTCATQPPGSSSMTPPTME